MRRRVRKSALLILLLPVLLVPLATSADQPYIPTPLPPSAFRAVEEPAVPPVAAFEWTQTAPSPSPAVSGHSGAPPAAPPRSKPETVKRRALKGAVVGVATWYCQPGISRCTRGYPSDGAYGAAGPALRATLGRWRGRTVYVNGVAVKLVDWCACGGSHVIDVYHATWVTIPHPSHVTIRW